MKFMVIVCAAFLARVNPVSTIAKPACMNITRNPATNVHTKLIATVFAAEAALASLASESAAGTPCPRAALALKHGLRHEPAFRSFLPPPARRPASAGRPKAGLYLAAIDFRRARFPQLTVSTVVRVAPGVNV